ncbi:MAG: PASTA domain-containing protein [Prevotellaceae bacterium]|nr:PASTA domain-containing protein [Candidatus Faecinaster equi]
MANKSTTQESTIKIWPHIVAIAFIFIALLLVVIHLMNSYTHHGEEVLVPNVTGMTPTEALKTLEDADLSGTIFDSIYVKNTTRDIVYSQAISPGNIVKKGRIIHLTINTGEAPSLTIPDIADNCSLREATIKLQSLGFVLNPVEYIYGEKNWVYSVKANGKLVLAGSKIPADSRITLIVGDGTYYEEDFEDMPNDSINTENTQNIDDLIF